MQRLAWWGVISSAGSPALLVAGSTAAAAVQPRSYNPVADTISALAGRVILMAVGAATIGVAASPEHAGHGGSPPHVFLAAAGFVAMAAWPVAGRVPRPSVPGLRVPYGLRPAVAVSATAVMAGLLLWFGAELILAGHQVGLAERALAGIQALWPLVVVLTCLRSGAGVSIASCETSLRAADARRAPGPLPPRGRGRDG